MTPLDNLVEDALEQFILETDEERLPDGKYHPSSMWQCARAAILGVRGFSASAVPDAQARRVFRIGNLYHSLVQNALQYASSPKVTGFYPEFGIDVPEWNVVGHGDGLIEMDGLWYVLEIKSTKSLRYTPKEDHLRQASVYFTAARDFGWWDMGTGNLLPPLGNALQGIILVYLNKNDMDIRQYTYPYNPQWRKDIEARVKELDRYRLSDAMNYIEIDPDFFRDNLPPKLPLDRGKPNWYLSYCNYRGSGFCCADNEEDDW